MSLRGERTCLQNCCCSNVISALLCWQSVTVSESISRLHRMASHRWPTLRSKWSKRGQEECQQRLQCTVWSRATSCCFFGLAPWWGRLFGTRRPAPTFTVCWRAIAPLPQYCLSVSGWPSASSPWSRPTGFAPPQSCLAWYLCHCSGRCV